MKKDGEDTMKSNHVIKSYFVEGGEGTKIYVEEKGNPAGRPLLFIHGFNQSRLVWNKQVDSHLANEFRIVTIDNRGHGLSEKPKDQYSHSKLWADDIQSVIGTLGLDQPVLIGWSYGGLIICDYLRHYGDKEIRGINLVGARSRIGVPEAIAETGTEYFLLRSKLFSDDVSESMYALEKFIQLCTFHELSPHDLYFFLGFNAIVPPYVRKGLMSRSISNHDLLETIQKPVLITHGIEDQIVLLSHAQYNAEKLRNVTASYYEEVGHNPFWENSSRFNHELRDFVISLG